VNAGRWVTDVLKLRYIDDMNVLGQFTVLVGFAFNNFTDNVPYFLQPRSRLTIVCRGMVSAVEVAAYQPASRVDGDRRISRLLHRFRGANLRAVRRGHHVCLVPRRRAHAHTQDANTSAHCVQPHSRCVLVT